MLVLSVLRLTAFLHNQDPSRTAENSHASFHRSLIPRLEGWFAAFRGLPILGLYLRRGRHEPAGLEPTITSPIDPATESFEPVRERVTAIGCVRQAQDVHPANIGKRLHVADLHDHRLFVVSADCDPGLEQHVGTGLVLALAL